MYVKVFVMLGFTPEKIIRTGGIITVGLVVFAESGLMAGQWWQITFTSLALFGLVLALQVFTDALRDALDPRLRH